MNKTPFIRELTEARMFNNAKDIKGMSAREIADLVYLLFMLLEVIRWTTKSESKSYASKTMALSPYESMFYSGTDLGNLLAVLNQQDMFAGQLKVDHNLSLPLFQINRYLGAVRSGSNSSGSEDQTFFWRLEDYLKVYSNSAFRKLRRDIGDWTNLANADKRRITNLLRSELDKNASQIDLYLWFKSNFKLDESILENVIKSEIEKVKKLSGGWAGATATILTSMQVQARPSDKRSQENRFHQNNVPKSTDQGTHFSSSYNTPYINSSNISGSHISESSQELFPNVIKAIRTVCPEVEEIWFHGSRATGSNRDDSDWDILAVVPNTINYLEAVRSITALNKRFENFDIQPARRSMGLYATTQEEGRLLWSNQNSPSTADRSTVSLEENNVRSDMGQGPKSYATGSKIGGGTGGILNISRSYNTALNRSDVPVDESAYTSTDYIDDGLTDLVNSWTDQGIELDLNVKRDGSFEINRIEVPRDSRNQGIGSAIMQSLTDYADAHNATISLTPATDFGGSSVTRLKSFYKRFGFVNNTGGKKDFRYSNTMIRRAKNSALEEDVPTISYNDKLNPALWNGYELHADVKEALGNIANKFSEFLDIKQLRIVDYIITGSNCAFNYTKQSDIDLHIIVDASALGDTPLLEPFLLAKKSLWNSGHDITIKGFTVELYAEDANKAEDTLVATGVYSLLDDAWLKKPTHEKVTINDRAVISKVEDIVHQIHSIAKNGADRAELDLLRKHIKKMRQAGLSTGGEFSVENLAFKVLRNMGVFELMNDYDKRKEDDELSLDEEQINEIGANDYLQPLSLSKNIIQTAKKAGNIENQDVWVINDQGKRDLYFFKDLDNNLEAYILIDATPASNGYYRYHRMENKTNKPGRVTALVIFVTAKLGKKIYISKEEELTKPGKDWLLKLIKQPRGNLKITDQTNGSVDINNLENEWSSAFDSEPGPTEIYIECTNSEHIKNRITEQVGFMMPYLSYFVRDNLI